MPSPSEMMVPTSSTLNLCVVVLNLLLKELRDLVCVDLSHTFFRQFSIYLWPRCAPALLLETHAPDSTLSQAFQTAAH